MRRLLIADASEPFTDALTEVFRNEFELRICHDGEEALEALLSFQPDVLVLNLWLPFKDGLTVLQESAHRPGVILAISTYINTYIENRAGELGVQYIMPMPSVNAVRVRLMDMVATMALPKRDLSGQTVVLLHTLGFHTHLDGYRQLCIGIPLYARNPSISLSKELYPAVATELGLPDARAVERSIRNAIEDAWKHRDPAVWVKYFLPKPDGMIPCPTNKAFLSHLAEMLEL